jgi:hypothetical protein
MTKKTLFSRRALSFLILACAAGIAYISMPSASVEVVKPLSPLPRLPNLNIQQWSTKNSMPIWFLAAQGQHLEINIRTNAGSIQDGQHPGLAWLTLATLQKKLGQNDLAPSLFNGRFFTDIRYQLSAEPRHLLLQLKHLINTLKDPFTHKECAAGQQLINTWQQHISLADQQLAQQRFTHYADRHNPMSNPFRWQCDKVNTFKDSFYNRANSQIFLAGQISQQEAFLISNKLSRAFASGNKVSVTTPELPNSNQQLTLESATQHRLSWLTPQPNDKDLLVWQLFTDLLPQNAINTPWESAQWGALQLQFEQSNLRLVIPALAGTLASLNQVTPAQLHQSKRLLLQRTGRKLSTFDGKVMHVKNAIYRQADFTPNSLLIDINDLSITDLQPAISRFQRSPMILQSPITEAVTADTPSPP